MVDGLRRFGWTFASHPYGHIDLGRKGLTAAAVNEDTEHWLSEVGSLLGPTNLYITPFGSKAAPAGWALYLDRYAALATAGKPIEQGES